ncbi:MAG: hypothetical protein PHX10_14400 [Gallionellaceae bacterium]|nr:hypothetical protein [Gallionellaceae bacterium]
MASRIAPARVKPIDIDGIRYEAVWGAMGLFRASEIKTGKVLWELTLYHYKYNDILETDVQDVFVAAMAKESDASILVTDERATVYRVDLKDRASRIVKWPVGLKPVSREPLTVELVIENGMDRVVQFDKPSIGFGGRLTNNLFHVKADGVEIPYRGMMKKRVPPGDFLKLKPLQEFRVKLDLSADYDVPRTARQIEVSFEHTNHFSADNFLLHSPYPLTIK